MSECLCVRVYIMCVHAPICMCVLGLCLNGSRGVAGSWKRPSDGLTSAAVLVKGEGDTVVVVGGGGEMTS